MRTVKGWVVAMGLAVIGCGGHSKSNEPARNACHNAIDKIEECQIELGADGPTEDEVAECLPSDACVANCLNAASCAEIRAGLNGTANAFVDCVVACPD